MPDANYLETFLLTYNSFISSVDLMKQLIKRYPRVLESPRRLAVVVEVVERGRNARVLARACSRARPYGQGSQRKKNARSS